MREQYFALLISHREIIPAAVVKKAETFEVYAIAIDDRPGHDRYLWSPGTILRGADAEKPHEHDDKQCRKSPTHLRSMSQP